MGGADVGGRGEETIRFIHVHVCVASSNDGEDGPLDADVCAGNRPAGVDMDHVRRVARKQGHKAR